LESKISKCYVAITTDGRPCHLHWFIGPEENDRLKSHFNSGFPKIADDEMLLEGGYTHPEFRGLGLLAVAMDQIPKIGKRRNTRWILGFIRENNGASLKGSKRAGFVPYMLRNEKWRCFRRSLEYVMLPKNAVFPFEE
jgi:GNAT superfamily N-acetyltransferase